jgi:predicted O-methyltransferase YrrM
MTIPFHPSLLTQVVLALALSLTSGLGQETALDKKVKAFLDSHEGTWHDLNVPYGDGKFLHDLVLKNHYKHALEIGTSTGHSGIWIAWALSKTGGKLVTIEIDKERREQALANFKEAGLSDYIDSRLADAHDLVPKLEGTFDFVFSDADKDWYKNYFVAIAPKMSVGGCFTAHNVTTHMAGIREFLEYLKKVPNFETTIETEKTTGISLSYKRSE